MATVGDVYGSDVREGLFPQIYVPYHQYAMDSGSMGLVVRCSDLVSLAASACSILKRMDPDQAFYDMAPLEEYFSQWHNRRRANLFLIGVSSALALALAFVGIYGVVSYHVGRRTQEIGIRMALGAQPRSIIRMMVMQSMMSAFAGLLFGLAGALALTRYIASLLFGVTTSDPAVFAMISILVVVVAYIASVLPSRRATGIELASALRNE